eukprot:1177451-Prymnesium_polylepis.1
MLARDLDDEAKHTVEGETAAVDGELAPRGFGIILHGGRGGRGALHGPGGRGGRGALHGPGGFRCRRCNRRRGGLLIARTVSRTVARAVAPAGARAGARTVATSRA